MNIGSIETNQTNFPISISTGSCYNDEKTEIKSMSSLIVGYAKDNCIIASDSRNTILTSSKYFDNYPKIFKLNENIVIGVVGINSYYQEGKRQEIGESIINLSPRNYEAELLYISAQVKKHIPSGRNTQFIIVERKDFSIFLKEINITNEAIHYIQHNGTQKYITYGVQHCRSSLLHDFSAPIKMPCIDTIRELIKMDKEADEVVNKPGTVGGPIQAYSITIDNIFDLSDKNAPHDFDDFFAEYNEEKF